eukprot:TRINITY_DN27711_c0_g1_i1.p1 TRINITY_DN27711_c0_g1~~TRINITY_DN27711_c0_g1_i1.p1  ORF type:complete len:132 (+),score=19.15 TRINITY_DN27711_c0_g1_i1:75-470(+)
MGGGAGVAANRELQTLCNLESASGLSSLLGDVPSGTACKDCPRGWDDEFGCDVAKCLTYRPSTVLTVHQKLPTPAVVDEIIAALHAAACLHSVRPALLLDYYRRKRCIGGAEALLQEVRDVLRRKRVEVDE